MELLCFGWLLRAIVLLCCQFRLMSGSSRCEFTQLVSSIESQVYGNSSGHEVLWGNCTGLYNEIQSWGGASSANSGSSPVWVQSTCDSDNMCDWNALVERYLLQGFNGNSDVLQECTEVRNQQQDLQCNDGTGSDSTPSPSPPGPPTGGNSSLWIAEDHDHLATTSSSGSWGEEPDVEPVALQSSPVEAGTISLPLASSDMLATLVLVSDAPYGGDRRRRLSANESGSAPEPVVTPVARSYNGNDWEGTMPAPVSFACSGNSCTAQLPPATESSHYELRVFNGTDRSALAPAVTAARFLTQATFGATISEITNLTGATLEETDVRIEQWVQQQMNMDPTLHRVYLRKRTNPPMQHNHHLMMRCAQSQCIVL